MDVSWGLEPILSEYLDLRGVNNNLIFSWEVISLLDS